MARDLAEVVQVLPSSSGVKVHSSMCWELIKILDKVINILPAIESACPGGRSGIEELCSLNNAMDKARLLIQHCASSKLYLAINGASILLRCERIRSTLDKSLSRIQDMVPVLLAAQIAKILNYVRDAKFMIDSIEGEAGKVLLELLAQTDSPKESEVKALRIASLKLNITSPKALLIERRSIKKLHDDVHGTDSKKEKILNCLLYLLEKYEKDITEQKESINPESKSLISHTTSCYVAGNFGNEPPDQDKAHAGLQTSESLPEEFRCPILSKLMHDPAAVASGQTYEKIWVEKWFCQGNDTCSMKKVSDVCERQCISTQDPCAQPKPATFSYCSSISSLISVSPRLLDKSMIHSDNSNVSHASCSSDSILVEDSESLKDNSAKIFSWSDEYRKYYTFTNFRQDMYLKFLFQLSDLPSKAQGEAVEELKFLMESDEETCSAMLSNGFIEALMNFLKNAQKLSDVQALRTGVQILLLSLSCLRVDIQAVAEDAFEMSLSLLQCETSLEALMIMQIVCRYPGSIPNIASSGALPFILEYLESDGAELEFAVKILCDLSSYSEIQLQIISSGCVSKLVPLLRNRTLAEHCIKIVHNLSETEEGRVVISQTNGCLASITELLDVGNKEEQEHSVIILHSLCSHSYGNCKLVMNEGMIMYLVSISVNGNDKAKEFSIKLLHMLRDLERGDCFQSFPSQLESIESSESQPKGMQCSESSCSLSELKPEPVKEQDNISNTRQPSSSPSGFLARKLKFFSKPGSLSLPCVSGDR